MIRHDTNKGMNICDNICHKKVDCRVLVSCEKPSAPRVALIHTEGDPIAAEADIAIPIPRTSRWFTPFLSVLPLQILAYQTALAMGKDIDRPRNLAKSVTVE